MSRIDPSSEPRRVGVREFRGHLADYLRQARDGSTFLVMSRDEILAEIRPPSSATLAPRKPGALRGRVWMAEDFDALPDDIVAALHEPIE